MPDDVTTQGYRAFLSYSHSDRIAAWRWRRHTAEHFSIDPDLIGRRTPIGPVPPRLRPIFHDRQDFPAGGELGVLTREALEQSRRADPAGIADRRPQRAYVNEEVRQFRHRHPDRPVVAIIVKGRPNDPAQECFPPAYRFALDDAGQVTTSSVTAAGR